MQFLLYFLIDVDECKISLDQCGIGSSCNNTIGSYICNCKPGFVGIGNKCIGGYKAKLGAFICARWYLWFEVYVSLCESSKSNQHKRIQNLTDRRQTVDYLQRRGGVEFRATEGKSRR